LNAAEAANPSSGYQEEYYWALQALKLSQGNFSNKWMWYMA
jgi:hypothetical protein